MNNFEHRLKGGHPNSLGNTVEIVEEVLADHQKLDELFNCYFSADEVVRLRVSSAMKRISKAEKSLLLPYLDQLLTDIAQIDQASTQWTLAKLFERYEKDFSDAQRQQATNILKHNLAHHNDWIVLIETMKTLSKWAQKEEALQKWMQPHLQRLAADPRKSVSNKAKKLLQHQ